MFEVKTSKKRFDANKVEILEWGYPYIVRSALNNGVKGFLNEDSKYLNEGNTISFGQDTATMFYQKQPYFTGDKIKVLKSKSESFEAENAQFFICSMSKPFKSFAWGSSSFSVEIIENQKIQLPVKNGKLDYCYMSLLISAIQKLVIKDVVLYADRKIEATKQVINL